MGSSAAFALIPLLICGFLFNAIFVPLRYFSSKAEGQKLFFMAAGSGALISSLVFAITGVLLSLKAVPPWVLVIAHAIDASIPIPFACRLIATLVAGAALGIALNFLLWPFYGWSSKKVAKGIYNKLIDKHGNSLTQLLRKATDRQKLVILTLKSRKIYCGRILEVPSSIERDDACIEILPSFSAYRDKDTLRMGRERTDYPVIALWEARRYLDSRKSVLETFEYLVRKIGEDSYDREELIAARNSLAKDISDAEAGIQSVGEPPNFDANDWIKIIPVGEIESASFYDPDAYEKWFAPETGSSQPTI